LNAHFPPQGIGSHSPVSLLHVFPGVQIVKQSPFARRTAPTPVANAAVEIASAAAPAAQFENNNSIARRMPRAYAPPHAGDVRMKRWSVVIAAPGRTWTADLTGTRGTIVGEGETCTIRITGAQLAERHASLLARDEEVLIEPLGGDVLVNDVPVSAQSVVRAGDELRLGLARLLFQREAGAVAVRPRMVPLEEFLARLGEEARRGAPRPLGLALIASVGLNVTARQSLTRRVVDEVLRSGVIACFSELTPEVLAVQLPELSANALSTLFKRLPEVAGPRASVALARAPEDGLDGDTLLGRCWDSLLPPADDEPVFTDPTMVRLAALMESLAGEGGDVCVVGAPGVGRRTLLEVLARAAGRKLHEVSAFDSAGASRAKAGEWLLLRDAGDADFSLRTVKTRVLATSTRPLSGFAHVIEVPTLAARPDDVLPLAEAFVSRARAAVGRPRLALGSDARAMLQAWHWSGNVRELKNVLARAARGAVRDEIGRDALPVNFSTETPADDLRGAMQSAERELLLETLARTKWNVTVAATRLGIPRRTMVHRMSKLGLKRPAR